MKTFVLTLLLASYSLAGVLSEKEVEFTKRASAAKNAIGLIGPSDDAPIWNGIYVAALSHKFAVTQDPADLAEMENILSSLVTLHDVTGIPGIIARRILPITKPLAPDFNPARGNFAGQMYKSHLSHDQYVGYLYGLMESWPFLQNPELKLRVRNVALQIGHHFLNNGEKIVGPGTNLSFDPSVLPKEDFPDFLSKIAKSFFPRGGKAMYALQLLKVTSKITQDPTLTAAYQKLIQDRDYHVLVRDNTQGNVEKDIENNISYINLFAKLYVGTAVKATKDSLRAEVAQNLGHIALYSLSHAEENPSIRAHYTEALLRAHSHVARHGNSFWNFLSISQTRHDAQGVSEAKKSLISFPMDNYGTRFNSGDPKIKMYKGLMANFFKGSKWTFYSYEPLPIERRPMHSFAWQHNAFLMNGQFSNVDCPGVAYVAAYWLGRVNGFIASEE